MCMKINQLEQESITDDNLLIRNATIADAEALQRLYHEYLGNHKAYELQSIIENFESENIIVAINNDAQIIGALTYIQVFSSGEMEFNITEDGGIFIGCINSINIGDECISFDNDIKYELRGLCVDKAYRHQGVATALLENAQCEMQAPAYALVWAPGGEVRAQQLWESHGFVLQEKVENIRALLPEFCEKCVERKNGCKYCEVHVYVEGKSK